MTGLVLLRAAAEDDEPFLRQLYADCHPEFSQLPPPVGAGILDLQFRAQRSQYRDGYPGSTDHVIELDGQAAGRCWTAAAPDRLQVLDIAVLSGFRGRGVARTVLTTVREQASADRLPVRLSVWPDNQVALRLYTGLGFVPDSEHNGYLGLIWPAKT